MSPDISKCIDDIWYLYETDGWYLTSLNIDEAYSTLEHDLPPFVAQAPADLHPVILIGTINVLSVFMAIDRTIDVLMRLDREWVDGTVAKVLSGQLEQLGFAHTNDSTTAGSTSFERTAKSLVVTGTKCIVTFYRDVIATGKMTINGGNDSPSTPGTTIKQPRVIPEEFTVYSGWKPPESSLPLEGIEKYIERIGRYDIWIREPRSEVLHRGRTPAKSKGFPDPRLVRLLKVILMQAHRDCIPLIDLFKSLWPHESRVSELLVRSRKKQMANAVSECRRHFPNCLELTWHYDEPYSRIILKRQSFTYCFISPMVGTNSHETL